MFPSSRPHHILLLFSLILFLYTAGVHTFLNSQTSYGDALRHRPAWILALNSIIPDFNLSPSWFTTGEESPLEMKALTTLIHSLNTEAKLTGLGRVFAVSLFQEFVSAKKCISDNKKKHSTNRVNTPKFTYVVVGLPRTGTTFLHQLLSLDTETWRAPRNHEYMDPCPVPANHHHGPDRGMMDNIRIWIQGCKMGVTRMLLPTMSHLHHIDAETPEEDVVLMAHVWASLLFPTIFFIPSYTHWLQEHPEAIDMGVTYMHEILESHFRAVASTPDSSLPWLLKTPQHTFQIPQLMKHFGPGVRVIWMHRDPLQSMSSVVSVVAAMIGIGSDVLKDGAMARKSANETIELWKWALHKAQADRDASMVGEVHDVQFEDMIRDVIGTVKGIYAHYGLTLLPHVEAKMRTFASSWHGNGFSGKHKHSLERFGIETKELRREMRDRWWQAAG